MSVATFWMTHAVKGLNRRLLELDLQALIHMESVSNPEPRLDDCEEPGFDPPVVLPPRPLTQDEFEVRIALAGNWRQTVGVIAFVCPSNKDRADAREHFLSKCHAYLGSEIGVVLIDTITSRRANLSNELAAKFGTGGPQLADCHTYVSSFRPSPRDCNIPRLDVWAHPAEVGQRIPSVPLPLASGPPLMIDLESTYTEACADHGL